MKLFVHRGDLVREEMLPAENVRPRDEFVEVIVKGEGRCRRERLEAVVPDVAAALTSVNRSILTLAEGQDQIVQELRQRRLKG